MVALREFLQSSSEDTTGPLGEALWRSPLRQLPEPPWAPRKEFASICGGKSSTGWRNLWVCGGEQDGRYLADVWRSVDGAATWQQVECGPHWCGRACFGIAGGATPPDPVRGRPKGIIYIVAGQGSSGFLSDVWASDTAGRTWHRMCAKAPFGPRMDVACATVPGEPLHLIVGGGCSLETHRDLWLSIDAGETFAEVDINSMAVPPAMTLMAFPPGLLCVAQSDQSARLGVWKLKIGERDLSGLQASLEPIDEYTNSFDFENSLVTNSQSLPRRPFLAIDLEIETLLGWDSKASCLFAQPMRHDPTVLYYLGAAAAGPVHIACDMDTSYVSEKMRHGRIWILDGIGAWASDRKQFRAQDFFLRLLGKRLEATYSLPSEIMSGKIRPMLLPGPRRAQTTSGKVDEGNWIIQPATAPSGA